MTGGVELLGDSFPWFGGGLCGGSVDFLGGGRPGCFLGGAAGLEGAVILRVRE